MIEQLIDPGAVKIPDGYDVLRCNSSRTLLPVYDTPALIICFLLRDFVSSRRTTGFYQVSMDDRNDIISLLRRFIQEFEFF
jgi:hypothetical protein